MYGNHATNLQRLEVNVDYKLRGPPRCGLFSRMVTRIYYIFIFLVFFKLPDLGFWLHKSWGFDSSFDKDIETTGCMERRHLEAMCTMIKKEKQESI